MFKYLHSHFAIGIYSLMTAVCFAGEAKKTGDITGTNFPKDAEGRVYHVGLKKGEIANNVLLVGDPERAKLIVTMLDDPASVFSYTSSRGFTTYTGTRKGKPVSIVSIGMGYPMMDFAVREIRAITEGPLSFIRLGSCGTPHDDVEIGSLVVADESFAVMVHYDAYHQESKSLDSSSYFDMTSSIKPDASLHSNLISALQKQSNGTFPVVEASDATADTFYGSQGRIDPGFYDYNQDLISQIMHAHPNTGSLQMETFHLFHLASLSKESQGKIRAAACAIVLAQRKSDQFLSNARKYELEKKAGEACLDALVE